MEKTYSEAKKSLDLPEELLIFNSKELNLPDFDQTPSIFLIQNNFHDFPKHTEVPAHSLFPITYDDSFSQYIFHQPEEAHEDIFELSGMLSSSSDYLCNVSFSNENTENPDYIERKQKIEKRRREDPYGFLKPEYDSRFWPGRNIKQIEEHSKSQNKRSSSVDLKQKNKNSEIPDPLRKESNDLLKTLLQNKETSRNKFKIPMQLNKSKTPENSTVQVSLLHATILVDKRKMYRPIFEETPDQFPALHFSSFHGDTHCPFERPPQNIEEYLASQKKICENKRNHILNPKFPSAGAMDMNFCELCRVKFKDAKLHHESELHRSRAKSNIWDSIDKIALKCNQEFVKKYPVPKQDENNF